MMKKEKKVKNPELDGFILRENIKKGEIKTPFSPQNTFFLPVSLFF